MVIDALSEEYLVCPAHSLARVIQFGEKHDKEIKKKKQNRIYYDSNIVRSKIAESEKNGMLQQISRKMFISGNEITHLIKVFIDT